MNITKDYSCSLIRLLATSLIIICHSFEWIGFSLGKSWALGIIGNWCAVGVQIFLFLSGYLYGKKKLFENETRLEFVYRNFKKILVDYYIYLLIVVIPVYGFLSPGTITVDKAIKLFTGADVVGGYTIYGSFLIY